MADSNVAAEVAKAVYEDAGHEIIQPTGKTLSLIPRAVRAALQPLERWIMVQEYNLEMLKKTLDYKLANVDPEKIVTPEPYVAVPALQAVTYCMDNEELRNMYANLLAKSMNEATKNGVHPSYVEIIKQLCPDEAKLLCYLMENPQIPAIGIRLTNKPEDGYVNVINLFSDIGYKCNCENPDNIERYLCNLIRLGLVENPDGVGFMDEQMYQTVLSHPYVKEKLEKMEGKNEKLPHAITVNKLIRMTAFGEQFCKICIKDD